MNVPRINVITNLLRGGGWLGELPHQENGWEIYPHKPWNSHTEGVILGFFCTKKGVLVARETVNPLRPLYATRKYRQFWV